jgi:hypothetical protein
MSFHGLRSITLSFFIAVSLPTHTGQALAQSDESNVSGTVGAGSPLEEPAGPAEGGSGAGFGNGGQGLQQPEPEAEEGADAEAPAEEMPDADQASPEQLEPEAAVAASSAIGEENAPADVLRNATDKVSLPGSSGSSGNLSYSVAIDVPDFRGLEPSISLDYNSSRKTKLGGLYQGWLGYAWGLDGFDVIERASPGLGLPSFDATDVFLLNGEELVACVAGTVSPSCSTGGTHATENESFQRVAFSSTTNDWTVTGRTGTVSTFRSVSAVAGTSPASGTPEYDLGKNYRWLLSSVTDTHGNSVSYSYACPEIATSPKTAVCYPNTVSYNGTVVSFHREARPDVILMANGHDIAATKERIKTISVKVGGVLRAAYALTYNQAPFSNASRLIKAELYGSNATVAADGAITPPTSGFIKKTLGSFTYQDASATTYSDLPAGVLPSNPELEMAPDLNFDGKDELFGDQVTTTRHYQAGEGWTTRESRQQFQIMFGLDGVPTKRQPSNLEKQAELAEEESGSSGPAVGIIGDAKFLGRFDAARAFKDYAVIVTTRTKTNTSDGPEYNTSTSKYVALTGANLDRTETGCGGTSPFTPPCSALEKSQSFAADMDGDGVDQLHKLASYSLVGVGDFKGNGRQRPMTKNGVAELNGSSWSIVIPAPVTDCKTTDFSGAWQNICGLADVNGDGATDLIRYVGLTSDQLFIYLSTGRSFVALRKDASQQHFSVSGPPDVADFDNDGKADLLWGTEPSSSYAPYDRRFHALQFGAASNATVQHAALAFSSELRTLGDFNGDGLPDLTGDGQTYGSGSAVKLTSAGLGNPNLLRSVVNELGATVSVEYTPSSRWTNGYMARVMHAVTKITVDDGRGQTAATSYAYHGGKYDPAARKFLGYQKITDTKPLANGETVSPSIETTYRQDLASYGLPDLVVWKDGAGTVRKQVDDTWTVTLATKPYKALNTQTDTVLAR